MDADALEKAIQEKVAAGRGRPPEEGEVEHQQIEEGSPDDTDDVVETQPQIVAPPPADAAAAADAAEEALPEGASQEEIQEAREQAEEFWVGRYGTKEEAEAGLAAKDSTIGRLGQKLGQLERELAESRQAKPEEDAAEEAASAEELDIPAWAEWADHEISAGNAEQAAIRALGEGGLDGYRVLINRWLGAVDEDGEPDYEARAHAAQFNAEVMIEMQRTQAAPAPAAAPAQTPTEQAVTTPASTAGEREAAEQILAAQYPGWEQERNKMEQIVATLPQDTVAFLQAEARMGIAGRARALEYLYLAARQRSATAQQVADERAGASADAAIVAATVASAEATTSRTPPSEAEASELKRRNELRKEWGLAPLAE